MEWCTGNGTLHSMYGHAGTVVVPDDELRVSQHTSAVKTSQTRHQGIQTLGGQLRFRIPQSEYSFNAPTMVDSNQSQNIIPLTSPRLTLGSRPPLPLGRCRQTAPTLLLDRKLTDPFSFEYNKRVQLAVGGCESAMSCHLWGYS